MHGVPIRVRVGDRVVIRVRVGVSVGLGLGLRLGLGLGLWSGVVDGKVGRDGAIIRDDESMNPLTCSMLRSLSFSSSPTHRLKNE